MFIACGMVDDLLECTGDEEDPFALDRYVEVSRDPTFGHTTQPGQGHTHAPGPATPPTAAASSSSSASARHTPQMGITALKMIPESKAVKSPETRRSGDSSSRPSSARQEAGSQSPKGHLLDLHLGRKHKRTPSGGQVAGEHHTSKAGESHSMSPRPGREGAQSPKGIFLDLHIARKHKRSLSGSEAQHNKPGDSPNVLSRAPGGKTEGVSSKGNFLDIHLNHRHGRFPSGGQGTADSASGKFCESPATSSEHLAKDASPTSDRRFISFLKTHIPFVSSPSQSPGINLRPQAFPCSTPEEEAPSSSPKKGAQRQPGHVRHSSDSGRITALHHQSAPPTPSKMQNRHSADLSAPPLRPRSIVVDGSRIQEGLWDL